MSSIEQPKRRGRPPKQRSNPDCANPACLVTCHPDCPNLHENQEAEQWQRALRAQQLGDDPTIRSTDALG